MANPIPVHNSGARQPNFPPDITYNPPDQPDKPYTTRSPEVAAAVAKSQASRAAYDRRQGGN